MINLKVIDNFANIKEQLEIISYLNTNTFSYLFCHTSTKNKRFITSSTIDYPQLVKLIFDEVNVGGEILDNILFSYVYKLLHKNNLSNKSIHRIKVNTTFPYPKNTKQKHGPIHYDLTELDVKAISIIYYINNSDGDTLFFDDKLKTIKKVSPRQGRAVVFDSNIKHAACCPINSIHRQVINFVLYK